jgi:hypothetical protein
MVDGETTDNRPTVERIRRMRIEADVVNEEIPSDFDLDLTFEVAGSVSKPAFHGVRPGRRLTATRRYFLVEIGVPERFASDADRDRFLRNAMRESVRTAEEAVKRRRLDWSLTAIRRAVDEVVDRCLSSPDQEDAAPPEGIGPESGGESVEPEQTDLAAKLPVKLYALAGDGWRYWEAWPAGGNVVVHTGVVGDRGQVTEIPVQPGEDPRDVIRRAARTPIEAGFSRIDEADHTTILVQYPQEVIRDAPHAMAVWREAERLLNEELGWLGLGRCVNVDYSGELTFTVIAMDEPLGIAAVREALARAGRLAGVAIAVDRDGRYVIVWPEDRQGAKLTY